MNIYHLTKYDQPGSLHPLWSRAGLCECALCQRGRRYYKNAESLPQEERDWMCRFYDAVIDKECEFEMYEAHNQEANSSG